MKKLSIDIETYSPVNIQFSGAYKYADHEDFEILIFAYSVDDGEVQVVDLAQGEAIPKDIESAILDDKVIKFAFNANFERVCLSKHFGLLYLNPISWRCTAVWANMLGLPGNLAGAAEVLKLGEDKQKMKVGKSLISYFCVPCRPTKTNGFRTRNLPRHDIEKWNLFKTYCAQDVVVEQAITHKLRNFQPPEHEWGLYAADQRINDNGVLIDKNLVENIIKYNETYTENLMDEAYKLTGLSNPNSLTQLKQWFRDVEDLPLDSLTAPVVKELLESDTISDTARRVLEIRQQLGKTSVKKYETMERASCIDNRVRGTMQFYGANRTGRWAGRLIQVQNLPRNADDIGVARELVANNDFETLELLYDNLSSTFSQLVRTAIVPAKGCKFVVSDFSAIEARVIAWLAKETWRMEVFATHGKIYEASASQMFNIPLDEVDKDLRQKGKISELALGYGGGPGALQQMGALEMGVAEEELQGLVDAWRNANRKITALWRVMNASALEAIKERSQVKTKYGITFTYKSGMLFVLLPSGRQLAYVKPHITTNRFGSESIGYWGIDQTKRVWCQQETYGGKLVENIVQAIARDILAETIVKTQNELKDAKIVMHVHDEVVLEVPEKQANQVEDWLVHTMSQEVSWAPGLVLDSEAFKADFYQK